MAEFLVSYDLEGDQSAERHARVASSFDRLGARRVLFSQWVMVGFTANHVFDSVADLFTRGDRLLVSPFSGYTAHNLRIGGFARARQGA